MTSLPMQFNFTISVLIQFSKIKRKTKMCVKKSFKSANITTRTGVEEGYNNIECTSTTPCYVIYRGRRRKDGG